MKIVFILLTLVSWFANAQLFGPSTKVDQAEEDQCRPAFRVATNANLHFLPTPKRGFTDLGELNAQGLLICSPRDSEYRLIFEGEFQTQNQEPELVSPAFPARITQLNFETKSEANLRFGMGLFWDPWVQTSHQVWGYHLTQLDFRSLAARTHISPIAEVGAQFVHQSDTSEFGGRISSGETWPNSEEGPNKDLTVWWNSHIKSKSSSLPPPVFFMIYARLGRYDFVNQDSNVKQRVGAQIAWLQESGLRTGLQILQHQSGVDGLVYQQTAPRMGSLFAEGLDLVPLGGQVIQGQTSDYWVGYRFADSQSELFFRLGQALMRSESERSHILTSQLGYSFLINSSVRSMLFLSQSQYSDGFILGVQDRQTLGLSVELIAY